MMFQKPSIAIALAFVASSSAFVPASFSHKAAVATTFVSTVPSYSNINNALFADVEESAEPAAETEVQSDVQAEAVTEVAEPVAEEPVAEEPAAKEEEDDINCVAYVVNLSYETQHGDLKEQFAKHGKVGKVFIPKNRDTGKNKGIAFVSMASEVERDAAIAGMNEAEMDGRTIYVDKAKPRGQVAKDISDLTKVYVGNISYETTAEALEKHFSQFGEVSNVYLPTDRTSGQPRGFAFLALKPEAALKAIEVSDGTLMDGRTIEVKESLPRGTKAPSRKNETKLYIGNISFDTEEGTLRELFEDYGPVVDLYVPLDQNTGRPRGFAFVTLEPENAQRAVQEVDGWEVDGRMLRVNEAQPKGRSTEGYSSQNQGYASTNECRMSQVQLQQPPVACMSVACSLQTSLTGHRAKVKMLEEGSISKEVYVSSWIIIILITCSPFLALGCVSCTIFNCHCNQDGDFVMRKIGWRTRNRLINQALVTKEIKSHTTMETEKRCNARPNVLRRIPLHGVSPEDEAQDSSTITTMLENESDYVHCRCVICLESYEVGDKISWARNSMYCNHSFHPACIKQWLLKKRSCPCCRYRIIRWDDMFFRLNAWSDFCCGRRSRVLSDKLHRELLMRCRDSGEYCREHGLLFPFVPPLLEEPYEPRNSELLECVKIVKLFEARMAAEKSGRVDDKPRSGEQQNPSPHFPDQLRIVGGRDSAPPGDLELANIDSVSEVSRLTNTREEEDTETSHRLPYSRNEEDVVTLRPQESIEDAAGVAAIDEAMSFSESQ